MSRVSGSYSSRADNHHKRGRAALRTGNYDIAVNAFDSAAKANPESALYPALRAWAAYMYADQTGMSFKGYTPATCIHAIENALKVTPSFEGGYTFLARIHLDEGNLDSAIACAHAALTINPRSVAAQGLLRRAESKAEQPASRFERLSAWWSRKAA